MILLLALSLTQAKLVTVCTKYPVPGIAHTLNPHAPKDKQVQERINFCEQVTIPDPPAWLDHMTPVTDFRRDPRAFT